MAAIHHDSVLYNVMGSGALSITGLLGSAQDPSDSAWVTVGSGVRFWLEYDVQANTASIKHSASSDLSTFDETTPPLDPKSVATVGSDGYTQALARILLGSVTVVDSVPTVTRLITSNLQLESYCVDGIALYGFNPSRF